MALPSFAPGAVVEWKGHVGEIRFVDDLYLTVCVCVNEQDRVRDVCIVVQNFQWNEIKLIKESTK